MFASWFPYLLDWPFERSAAVSRTPQSLIMLQYLPRQKRRAVLIGSRVVDIREYSSALTWPGTPWLPRFSLSRHRTSRVPFSGWPKRSKGLPDTRLLLPSRDGVANWSLVKLNRHGA